VLTPACNAANGNAQLPARLCPTTGTTPSPVALPTALETALAPVTSMLPSIIPAPVSSVLPVVCVKPLQKLCGK
jgi:hypothetical protein